VVGAGSKSIPAAEAKPSQSAIYLGKALGMAMGPMGKGGDLKAIISADNYILDGHHRWAATMLNNPEASVGGTGIEMSMTELIPVLRAAGDAYGNARRGEPSGGDVNIFQASMKDALNALKKIDGTTNEYVKAGDASKWLKSIGGEGVLGQRLEAIKAKGADVGAAPARAEMPVIDVEKGEVGDLAMRLKKGAIDVNPPYAKVADEKEAIPMDDKNKKIRGGIKEGSRRQNRRHNERFGLLMEGMLGITNLHPLQPLEGISDSTVTKKFNNWLFEEDEPEEGEEPHAYCGERSFLSAQEAESETEGAEDESNYSDSEIKALTKHPKDLKNK